MNVRVFEYLHKYFILPSVAVRPAPAIKSIYNGEPAVFLACGEFQTELLCYLRGFGGLAARLIEKPHRSSLSSPGCPRSPWAHHHRRRKFACCTEDRLQIKFHGLGDITSSNLIRRDEGLGFSSGMLKIYVLRCRFRVQGVCGITVGSATISIRMGLPGTGPAD